MRFYLDQMIGISVAEGLRQEGHDVVRAEDVGHERASDQSIHDHIVADNRILITLDHHFGDWTVLPLKQHPGVIRLRVHPAKSENMLELLLPFLSTYSDEEIYRNHLLIVSKYGVRQVRTVAEQ